MTGQTGHGGTERDTFGIRQAGQNGTYPFRDVPSRPVCPVSPPATTAMLTLTDTWQVIARFADRPTPDWRISPNKRIVSDWTYEIGDHRTVAGLRATGLIVTALRREPGGALVMVGKLTPPDIVVPSRVPLRRGNCVRS